MSLPKKGTRSRQWRDASETAAPKNKMTSTAGNTYGKTFSGDLAMSMLLEMHCGVTELKVEVKHLTATTESLKAKVESLVSWKNGIFGGAAVLAILWGMFKGLSGYMHFGPKPEPSAPIQMSASSDATPHSAPPIPAPMPTD